jgi:serine/threonine-protein kinase RsbW
MGAALPTPEPNSNGQICLTIGSRLEFLSMVHALIEGIARQFEVDEETANALQVAVIEAGTNAIQHGNLFAEDKSVTFYFRVNAREVTVQVDDHGMGFDPARVEDPTDPENLLDTSGRGLFLMRAVMDEVAFINRPDHGTTVRLRKTRP